MNKLFGIPSKTVNRLYKSLAVFLKTLISVRGYESACYKPCENWFQLSSEIVDASTSSSLYETRIYTTFPEVALRAKLRQGTVEEDGSGFVYSLKKSWQSIKEIKNDVVDGYKTRGHKSFDSIYDFINHGTFGGLDAIWLEEECLIETKELKEIIELWTEKTKIAVE